MEGAQLSTYGVRLRRSDDLRLPSHPAGCDESSFGDWAAQQRSAGRRLAVDLFSGAGGLSLGLEDAGWTVAAAVDNDPKSVLTHRHNFPGLAVNADLGDATARSALVRMLRTAGPIDLLAGGPPCQPFSRAGLSKIRSLVRDGHRSSHDERRELWRAFLDVALRTKPRAMLMENVPDMALGDNYRAVRVIVETLEEAGYFTDIRLVDAWRHGVPQHRKRLILLARNDVDEFHWPVERASRTTLADAIGDLPPLDGDIGSRSTTYEEPSRLSAFGKLMRLGAPPSQVWDHMTRPVRDDDRLIFDMMDSSTLYKDIPAELRRYKADTFDDKYKRLSWDDISRSITAHIAKDGYWYIHPDQPRTLTVREAARIQTFPDRFRFAGTRSDAFRQIGNAVPPLLGTTAAAVLLPVPAERHPTRKQFRSRQARSALTRWASVQNNGADWFMLPGAGVTVPVALVSAMLTTRPRERGIVGAVLAQIRGRHHIDLDDLLSLEMALPTAPARRTVRRVEPVIQDPRNWTRPVDEIAQLAKLQSAETDVFLMLCNVDVMLDNQSARRVAARFADSESDATQKLTDGRTDLARLLGAGDEAPTRMAALRLLGATVCRDVAPKCDSCPIARWCKTRTRKTSTIDTIVPDYSRP